mmetsp:Transcript_38963/g.122056  ORF Transcript_38963/g.122056 Transcript_38963/m.122056 type:complete len:239 (-) Transcript_38963:1648-2364(-)
MDKGLVFAGGMAVGALVATLAKKYLRRVPALGTAEAPIYRIALTGGPCGGKSSSLAHFSDALKKRGFDVYAVPEIPTILIMGGCKYPGVDGGRKLVEFETALIELQLQAEDSFLRCAASRGKPAAVVYDRGLMDIPAYLPREKWLQILAANDLTESYLLSRYDLVLHLVTAADGAEKFYTTGNNDARTETPDMARMLDSKVRESWSGHEKQFVIPNNGSFDDKLEAATAEVMNLIDSK